MAVAAAVVMVPLSIAAFVKPEVANGMPFWAFILMTLGFVGFAIGYTIFLGWITPPGAADPFARYRRPADKATFSELGRLAFAARSG
ncbi:hypothetical protein CFBP6624_25590 (plasmid) [Agrobacterium tumefaciens]|nr:hypothetical protein ASD85_26450 [Rhizobium sp. Root651]QCL92685.1 hypothetical protein CFBP6623_25265 [Agrobacterium tumefaciens]QCM03817.1 hypothetical protein CFBP6624_25590 [Agrobacterium tumefaciens]